MTASSEKQYFFLPFNIQFDEHMKKPTLNVPFISTFQYQIPIPEQGDRMKFLAS